MPGGDGNPSFVDQRIFSEQDTSFKVSKVYLGYTSNSCRSGEFQDYTYDRPTRTLTKRCDLTQPPAERDAHGPLSRVLELAEAERVEALLPTMVATQNPPNGGWDGRELYLEVGPRKFSWGNINGYGYPQASNLDALFSVFEGMPF